MCVNSVFQCCETLSGCILEDIPLQACNSTVQHVLGVSASRHLGLQKRFGGKHLTNHIRGSTLWSYQRLLALCVGCRMLIQQLLGGILDVNSSYVSVVDELELSQCFFDFLTLEHPNNNVHNIRLCRQLVLSGCITTTQLRQLQAADKVSCRWGGQTLAYAAWPNTTPSSTWRRHVSGQL